jgi:hypothetical protein
MLRERFEQWQSQTGWYMRELHGSISLTLVLWGFWTLAVLATGYRDWHAAVAAQQPVNMLGLVIHCVLAGVIGLVVLTWIELRLEPWRFSDE